MDEKEKEKILESYNPKPEVFEIWEDQNDATYKTIIKFKKSDPEVIFAIWDEDLDNISEVYIDKNTLNKIKELI